MTEILELISQYGFPIIVSVFCLLKLDKSLVSLNSSIDKLILKLEYSEQIKKQKKK